MLLVQNSFNNPLLSSVSVRYSNPEYQADQIFPIIPVDKRSGNYFVYDKENLRAPGDTRRAGLARARRVEYNTTKASYGPLTGRALEQGVEEDLLKEAADPLAPMTDATLNVADKMLLRREIDLAATIFDTAFMPFNNPLSGGDQWDAYSTSNPLKDVQNAIAAGKQNTVTFNTLILGYEVWSTLINHPVFQDRIKYSQLGVLTLELAARLFNVQRIIVGEAVVNSSVKGQTDDLGFIWGKKAVLANIKANPGIRDVSFGYHLTLKGEKFVDNWYEQPLRGYFVRDNDYYDRKIVADEAGYLLDTVIS